MNWNSLPYQNANSNHHRTTEIQISDRLTPYPVGVLARQDRPRSSRDTGFTTELEHCSPYQNWCNTQTLLYS